MISLRGTIIFGKEEEETDSHAPPTDQQPEEPTTTTPTGITNNNSILSTQQPKSSQFIWKGVWTFGSEIQEKNAGDPQQPSVHPFQYTFVRETLPKDVQVPSSVIEYEKQTKGQGTAKITTEGPDSETAGDETKGEATDKEETTHITLKAEESSSYQNNPSFVPRIETFADTTTFQDAAFSSKDFQQKIPPSGLWKGSFQTPTQLPHHRSLQPPTYVHVPESFHLFINATPPKNATTQFVDEENSEDDNAHNKAIQLPEGHFHVRGAGDNQYGIFELLGSMDPQTLVLQVQRMYVRTRKVSSSPGRKRKVPSQSTTISKPTTRKKQLSFKHKLELPLEKPRKIGTSVKKKKRSSDTSGKVLPSVKKRAKTSAASKNSPSLIGSKNNNNVASGKLLKLPPAGDPALARWRAAHFLYYQRYGVDITPMTPKYVVYEGEMLDTKRHGRGICLFSNGLLYEGEWKLDKEQGQGSLMSADRKRIMYRGEWLAGKMHGKGEYWYYDTRKKLVSQYKGEFRENVRHGEGTYELPGGASYTGQWRDNQMNGHGLFTWPDSSTYEGEFKNSKRHGQGLLRVSDGFIYEGSWSHNYMDGRGSATYPDGQYYVGSFVKGRREGRGTLHFTNGASYEGRFRDDGIDGQGTMKITQVTQVSTSDDGKDDFIIPVHFQSDMSHIHRKAGFTHGGK